MDGGTWWAFPIWAGTRPGGGRGQKILIDSDRREARSMCAHVCVRVLWYTLHGGYGLWRILYGLRAI